MSRYRSIIKFTTNKYEVEGLKLTLSLVEDRPPCSLSLWEKNSESIYYARTPKTKDADYLVKCNIFEDATLSLQSISSKSVACRTSAGSGMRFFAHTPEE
jgi:hypothetical protein